MIIENEIIERIKNIDWFSNCGSQLRRDTEYEVIYENSWEKATKHAKGKYWDKITQEIYGDLSEFLFENFPDKYHKVWNKYTKQGREMINIYVIPKVILYVEEFKVSEAIIDNIKWDMLAIIMEYTYRNEKDQVFYMELLKVYESGNFPCGWKGSWPEGKLIVF